MDTTTEHGQVVWHDLLTQDVTQASRFYADLLGWAYQIEHAPDFAWQPGAADYPLILSHEEAHGGFVNAGPDISPHWVAYVRVNNVMAVTARAKHLGAKIYREPFDVPGVGCSALIQDPQGAMICPYVATHRFPAPTGTFLWDELVTRDIEAAQGFYGELWGWGARDVDRGRIRPYVVFKGVDGTDVAGATLSEKEGPATWITYLATDDVDKTLAKAKKLGATPQIAAIDVPKFGRLAVLLDPTGAVFGLLKPSEF